MATIYGYCRVSTQDQTLDRQIRNIQAVYPSAMILQDKYTGTRMDRPSWSKLMKVVRSGDTIVFDAVSRMSRNAEEGIKTYFSLMDRGVELVFLKESYISTSTYKNAVQNSIPMTGTAVDCILEGVNQFLRTLAQDQIRKAFDQSQKEVDDKRQNTKEGMITAKLNGKQIGRSQGDKLTTKKSLESKEIMRTHCKDFGGSLTDPEVIKLTGLARNTYYKYKAQIKAETVSD